MRNEVFLEERTGKKTGFGGGRDLRLKILTLIQTIGGFDPHGSRLIRIFNRKGGRWWCAAVVVGCIVIQRKVVRKPVKGVHEDIWSQQGTLSQPNEMQPVEGGSETVCWQAWIYILKVGW